MYQPALITGLYRCSNCGLDVDHVQRTRRFWLCDKCWLEIMPNWEKTVIKEGRPPAWYADTEEQRQRIGAYWDWLGDMEERYPYPYRKQTRSQQYLSWLNDPERASSDDYYPFCACGRPRKVLEMGIPGLWGGPFTSKCEICDTKADIETYVKMSKSIHPEWDDEEWLDMLYRVCSRAFALGILPDYWFEIKRQQLVK